MPLFFEIKVRVNGEEKWANGHKVFKYLLEEYSKVSYKGRALDRDACGDEQESSSSHGLDQIGKMGKKQIHGN